jgi:hypothetical protein
MERTVSVPGDARLRLMDIMVLTGAVAAGLALARSTWTMVVDEPVGFPGYYGLAFRWALASAPCVSLCMVSVLALRLSRPRPPLRRLMREPGVLACCMALIGLIWGGIDAFPYFFIIPIYGDQFWYLLADETARGPAHWILVAWATLALTGQWRFRRDWFDRAGIVLGGYMVVAFWLAPLVVHYFFVFTGKMLF